MHLLLQLALSGTLRAASDASVGWHRGSNREAVDPATAEDRTMAHTHEFDCKQCGAHLDSKQDLDRHLKNKHSNEARSTSSSSSSGKSASASPPPNSNR
jgi:hypothetical protein